MGDARHDESIAAGASDYVMLDAMKIGGVTGWLRAAGIAEANGSDGLQSHPPRDQRPVACRHADDALAGIPRLDRPDLAEPLVVRMGTRIPRRAGLRPRVARGRRAPLSRRLNDTWWKQATTLPGN